MRDLRYNTRDFSEPIEFSNYGEYVDDGVVVRDRATATKLVYANVMPNYKSQKSDNGSLIGSDSVKISFINMQSEFVIRPNVTEVSIRNELYVVTSVDPFGINTQVIYITAKRKQ